MIPGRCDTPASTVSSLSEAKLSLDSTSYGGFNIIADHGSDMHGVSPVPSPHDPSDWGLITAPMTPRFVSKVHESTMLHKAVQGCNGTKIGISSSLSKDFNWRPFS